MRVLPGQYVDQETGLFYNWNRYYDPKTGRYITSDPMSVGEHFRRWRATAGALDQLPLEINSYAYVVNNPLRYVDPQGLMGTGWGGQKASGATPPPFPNGNYLPGFTPQDGICTIPGATGIVANGNTCVVGRKNSIRDQNDQYLRSITIEVDEFSGTSRTKLHFRYV